MVDSKTPTACPEHSQFIVQAEQLDKIIPKALDDIVTKNRDGLQLKYATEQDLAKIQRPIPAKFYKGALRGAFIYKRILPAIQKEALYLVGFMDTRRETITWHTSSLEGFDPTTRMVATASGSLYLIEDFVEGEADSRLLINVCAILHRDGAGSQFGIPHFFY